jgi:hypothetical protein
MDANTTVSGKAIYLELTKNEYTSQVLIVPEGITSKGNKQPLSLLRRTVSKWSPRKTWQQDNSYTHQTELVSTVHSVGAVTTITPVADLEDATKMALESLVNVYNLFDYLADKDWVVRGTPITLDVSVADIDDLAAYTTPAALMRRLTRSRKAAGFPDDLFPA